MPRFDSDTQPSDTLIRPATLLDEADTLLLKIASDPPDGERTRIRAAVHTSRRSNRWWQIILVFIVCFATGLILGVSVAMSAMSSR